MSPPEPLHKPAGLFMIGLTGNIACGKSTVVEMLADMGAWTLDADAVTHELQAPGQPVYEQIIAAFGAEMRSVPNGPLDRRKLGALVFSNPDELRRLEAIVHPAVRDHLGGWLAKVAAQAAAEDEPHPIAVVDAVKLLESSWRSLCDSIWVVSCLEVQQITRMVETRDMTLAEAQQRIQAQPPQAARITQADVVIDNSGPLEHTRQQVRVAWEELHDC